MLDNSLYNTEEVLNLLTLEQTGTDSYVGQSYFMGSANVFGGQVLGQSLYAATATVENRRPHSMHSLFILPGNHQLPIEYKVERVRDGGAFSTRRVVALQEGRQIFVMLASFHVNEEGLSHQKDASNLVAPESLASNVEAWKQQSPDSINPPHQPVPVDFRGNHNGDFFSTHVKSPIKQIWTRSPLPLSDDPLMHESLFAYVSDYGILWTTLQPHGLVIGDKRVQFASLDHTIWFHRPFRMDEWLYFSMESSNASGGRGLCFAYVYNRDGVLVATVAQEGLIRLRDKSLLRQPS